MADHDEPRSDGWTVAAIAVLVYALSSVLHEGIGHGLACVAVGGRVAELSSMHVNCAIADGHPELGRIVAAAGTVATLIGGALAYVAFRAAANSRPAQRYLLWLMMAVNLFQGTGYWLFSGIGNIGDWAAVIRGQEPSLAWRAGLTVAGAIGTWLAVRVAFTTLGPFIGGDNPARYDRARRLSLIAYFTGAAISIGAGLLNRSGGLLLVAISGAAASLGGTSGLVWGTNFLRGDGIARSAIGPIIIPRSRALIAGAAVAGIAFALILGPGLRF